MIGCSFVANRDYFGELGLLDSGMDVYGGENIELGIRVCVCVCVCARERETNKILLRRTSSACAELRTSVTNDKKKKKQTKRFQQPQVVQLS